MARVLFLSLAIAHLLGQIAAVQFDTASIGRNSLKGEYLKFVSRTYVPYGPDLAAEPRRPASEQPWKGFGYGFGAAEHWVYDSKNKYIYSQSEAGEYIAIVDYLKQPGNVTKFSIDFSSYQAELRDIVICPSKGLLFVSLFGYDRIVMFRAVDRSKPATPELIKEIDAGSSPDALKVSDNCKYLAVANQNEADSIEEGGGSVHIVSNFREDEPRAAPDVQKVSFRGFSDVELLQKNLHMPLTKNAMLYWRNESGIIKKETELWDSLIANYDPTMAMNPEFMAFNHDSTQLYVNLQTNSGLVVINPEAGEILEIAGYGLKSMTSGVGVDILEEAGCDRFASTGSFITNPCLYLGRAPDSITTVRVDGVDYVITAEEGSDFDLGEYEEKYDAKDLFNGTSFTLPGFKAHSQFFDRTDANSGCSANFNAECDEATVEGGWCASGFELTVGSAAVDYETDFKQPTMSKIVGFGGRGVGIYRIDDSGTMTPIWDSGSDFEVETCQSFPWAHNAIQDESFVTPQDPAYKVFSDKVEGYDTQNNPKEDGCTDRGDGLPGPCPMKETVGRQSLSDGPAVEAVAVGVACGRLVLVGCGENNAICVLYDISNINQPVLKKVFSLSPASEFLSPTLAYDQKTLGDIDSETILFLNHTDSPTGTTAILFGGAVSGTISMYEFECELDEEGAIQSLYQISGGAIAGIGIGSVVGVFLLVVVVVNVLGTLRRRRSVNVKETNVSNVNEGNQ